MVAPYYNRPSQAGLLAHFSYLAEQVDLPMVLYNVPGRTVTDIKVETVAELARRVGLSKSPVQARLKRLEAQGVITGYRAVLDHVRMGEAHVAFVEVKLSDTREAALQAFNRAVLAVPEIEECHMIASRFDYLMKVRSRDMADFRRILAEKISTLPHVSNTSSHVSMEAVVEQNFSLG